MNNKRKIIAALPSGVLSLVGSILIAIGNRDNNDKLISAGLILLLLMLLLLVPYLYIAISDLKAIRKYNKEIWYLRGKDNKTGYDYFLIDIIDKKATNLILEGLGTKNNLSDIYFDYHLNKKASFGYVYLKFDVEFLIGEEGMEILISPSEDVEMAEETESLEEEKYLECDFKEMTVQDIYIYLTNKMAECNELIDEYLLNKENNNF